MNHPTKRVATGLVLFIFSTISLAQSSFERDQAPNAHLLETFDAGWEDSWTHSTDEKYKGEFSVVNSELTINTPNKFYGLTALLSKPLDPSVGLVVQYETRYKKGYECGGSYLKLLTHVEGFTSDQLVDSTPYTVMFGPDKCGDPLGKIHTILRHEAPNGTISEKHQKPQPAPVTDALPHVYTLIIKPDNTMQIMVDGEVKADGSIFETFSPPINPPEDILDASDVKPEDWVDLSKLPDPSAQRPDDWDSRKVIPDLAAVKPSGWLDNEPLTIPSPAAKKPAAWDDEEDGEWEPPKIANPKCKRAGCGEWQRPTKANPDYKGEWTAPLIPNPDFQGAWVQKTIPNPDYFVDSEPLTHIGKIGAVAFELWTIDEGYTFDNIYVGQDAEEAARLRTELWEPKFVIAKKAFEVKAAAAKEQGKFKADEKVQPAIKGLPLLILDAFDKGFLKPYKPHVEPILDYIRGSPFVVYMAITTPILLICTLLLCFGMLPSKRVESKEAVFNKKDDLPVPDDEEVEEEEETPEGEEEAMHAGAAGEAKKKSEITAHEITPQEDEDEDEGVKPAARQRRTRKA